MLKKAGIVVAASAAGLLVASPLALAGDKVDNDHHKPGGHSADEINIDSNNTTNNNGSDSNRALVNVSGNNTNVPIQVCNNDVPINAIGGSANVKEIIAPITGALSILGDVNQVADNDIQADSSRDCTQDAGAGDINTQG